MQNITFIFLIILINFSNTYSQRDLISWSGLKMEAKIDDQTKFAVKPIVRHNNDLSSYQNTSIEFIINRKFGNKWFGQYLFRHWIWEDNVRVNFLWLDVGFNTLLNNKISSSTAARWHWSLTDSRQAADFIRIREKISIGKKKIKPNILIEGWWRIDAGGGFTRLRIEPGFSWAIAKGYSFAFNYRIQKDYNGFTGNEDHLVSTLSYSF